MSDLYAAAQAVIAERRVLIEAGTALPWFADEMNRMFVGNRSDGRKYGLWEIVYAGEPDLESLTPKASERERADAALIVAAVNTFARDTDALAETLERHREFRIYDECDHAHEDGDPNAVHVYEVGLTCEDAFLYSICRGCCTEDVFQTEACVDHHEQPCWPCPDARAALRALGLEA